MNLERSCDDEQNLTSEVQGLAYLPLPFDHSWTMNGTIMPEYESPAISSGLGMN